MGLYSAKYGLVLGFHGCEEDIRDRVVMGQIHLRHHNNPYDWLGFGNYFWENNLERAWDFARNPPGGRAYTRPAVLGAVIDLSLCLDLLETENILLVRESYDVLSTALATIKEDERPSNKNARGSRDYVLRNLDCAVIETLHKLRKEGGHTPFDSVRGMFAEGDELYPDAGFRNKNHIQICVRNPNCIKGYFIPGVEEDWPINT